MWLARCAWLSWVSVCVCGPSECLFHLLSLRIYRALTSNSLKMIVIIVHMMCLLKTGYFHFTRFTSLHKNRIYQKAVEVECAHFPSFDLPFDSLPPSQLCPSLSSCPLSGSMWHSTSIEKLSVGESHMQPFIQPFIQLSVWLQLAHVRPSLLCSSLFTCKQNFMILTCAPKINII